MNRRVPIFFYPHGKKENLLKNQQQQKNTTQQSLPLQLMCVLELIHAVFLTWDAGRDNKSDFSSFNICSKDATASLFDADQSLTVLLNRNTFSVSGWFVVISYYD